VVKTLPVTGAILAGGRSSRMGRDKAFLTLDGVPLITRQVALLRSLGIDDLLISGRSGVDYTVPSARVVIDQVADAGPLGGLSALLAAARHPWVLVIAVDLPYLTADYLQSLLAAGNGHTGIVPHGPRGYEPLVALYPRSLLARLESALAENRLGLQKLLQAAVEESVMQSREITSAERSLFTNWNTPQDIPATDH
jgi:molybdopterin-guanine dinucleotide biosynthesis protein A